MLTRLLLGLAACAAAGALAAESAEKTFEMAIVRGALAPPQRLLRVDKGDAVRLRLTSDTPGEIHLHGYRLEAKLDPGAPRILTFTAYATGRYPFEWHTAASPGQEGAQPGAAHRAPPFAVLEVRPK